MSSFSNWITQIFSLTLFNLRTIPERKGAAASSVIGIAGVVTVLVGVLSIAAGFSKAMMSSGAPDTAIVLRTGSDTEMTSGLTRDDVRAISDAKGLARNADGALASPELFVIINLPKRSTGTDANVPLRGVGNAAFSVRNSVNIVEGRRFAPGKSELIVGAGAARQFAGLDIGRTLRVGQNDWTIVGIFTADGQVSESEIWADSAVLQPAYHRGDTYQAVYAKLTSAAALGEFKDALSLNPNLNVKAVRQSDFFAEQSTTVTTFIKSIGVFVAGLMALGALFGAINTMYNAVAARTKEIATLRALGFGAFPVIISVLLESLILALAGGVLGSIIAYVAFNNYHASTINWQTFSQVAFAFNVSPELLFRAIKLAAIIGLIGGALPAIRAARIPIAAALRET